MLKRIANRLSTKKTRNTHSTQRSQQFSGEALERREMMTFVSSTPVTDMTQLASHFPTKSTATYLYLNFDGNSADKVDSFQSSNRNQDIHDILFKTNEIFAPFNVIVQRKYGNGSKSTSNGNTTIFIGDKESYGTGTGHALGPSHHTVGASNGSGAYTPWSSSDFPSVGNKGIFHTPNSDTYDIAFVDPVYYSGGSDVTRSNQWIADAVAHEAGHTFGLVHVLSSPDPDIMSYNSSNTRFIDEAFTITDLNYSASSGSNYNEPKLQPKYFHFLNVGLFPLPYTSTIVTQNSYTYLKQTLGSRTLDWANVADSSAVDPSYTDGFMPSLSVGGSRSGSVGKAGDFDVFSFSTSYSRSITVDVEQRNSSLDPVLLIYKSNGDLVAFDDDDGAGSESRHTFYASAGQDYRFVVGGYSNVSTGGYKIEVSQWFPPFVFEPIVIGFGPGAGPGQGGNEIGESDQPAAEQPAPIAGRPEIVHRDTALVQLFDNDSRDDYRHRASQLTGDYVDNALSL